jgi:hypothetical protein
MSREILATVVFQRRGTRCLTRVFGLKVGGKHLRLFSEHSPLQASVYNVNAKNWGAPSEAVGDIEQGKDRAATHASVYLRRVASLEIPPLNWKKSRSI